MLLLMLHQLMQDQGNTSAQLKNQIGVKQLDTSSFYNTLNSSYTGNFTVSLGSYPKTNIYYDVTFGFHSLNLYFQGQRLYLDLQVISKIKTSFTVNFRSKTANKLQMLKICFITKEFTYTDPFYILTFRSPTYNENILVKKPDPQFKLKSLGFTVPAGAQIQRTFLTGFDAYSQNPAPNINYDIFPQTFFVNKTHVNLKFSTMYQDVKLDFYCISLIFYVDSLIITNSLSKFTVGFAHTDTSVSQLFYSNNAISMTTQNLFVGVKSFHVNQHNPTTNWVNFQSVLTNSTYLHFITTNNVAGNYFKFQFLIIESWQCPSGLFYDHVANDCVFPCPSGTVSDSVSGMCITYCPTTVNYSNCLICQKNGVNIDCTVCNYGFSLTNLNTKFCTPKCGDGVYIKTLQQCQDGNLINGDGCSSSCAVQLTYECIYNKTTSLTDCLVVPSIPMDIKYQYLVKQPFQNQITLFFTIQPNDPIYYEKYAAIDWTKAIIPNITSNQIIYEYKNQPVPHLEIKMKYKQNLNNQNISFTLQNFDSNIYPNQFYGVSSTMIPIPSMKSQNNLDLNFYDDRIYQMAKATTVLCLILVTIYLFLFLIGFIIGKVYILQLSVAPQLTLLSLLCLQNFSPIFYGFTFLKYIFGYSYSYSSFNQYSVENKNIYESINFMDISVYFIYNYNFMFILPILSWIIGFIVYLISDKKQTQNKLNKKQTRIEKVIKLFIYELPLYFVLWFGLWTLTISQIQIKQMIKDSQLNQVLSYFGIGFLEIILIIYIIYFFLFSKKFINFKAFHQLFSYTKTQISFFQRKMSQHFYLYVFLEKIIISIILINFSLQKYTNLIILAQHIFIILFIVITKPYINQLLKYCTQNEEQRNFNKRQIVNYSISGLIQLSFFITNYFQYNNKNQWTNFIPFFIIFLLILQIIITIFLLFKNKRLFNDIKSLKQLFEKQKNNLDQLNQLKKFKMYQFNQTKNQLFQENQLKDVKNMNKNDLSSINNLVYLNTQEIKKKNVNQNQRLALNISRINLIQQKQKQNLQTDLQKKRKIQQSMRNAQAKLQIVNQQWKKFEKFGNSKNKDNKILINEIKRSEQPLFPLNQKVN